MHGLASDFKTDFLNERTLVLICFTRYATYLHFSEDLLITVEGELSINDGERLRVPSFVEDLYALIDQEVSSSSANSDGTISLQFAEGSILSLYDSSPQIESYSIVARGEVLARV